MALDLRRYGTLSVIYDTGMNYVVWALAIGLLLAAAGVDCASIAVAIGSISGEVVSRALGFAAADAAARSSG